MMVPSDQGPTWLSAMKEGQHWFQSGRIDLALRCFQRATELEPGRAEGWTNLGAALVESRRGDLAVEALKKAISLKPGLMVAYMTLGDAMRQLGRHAEATAAYRKAVAIQPLPIAMNKLACALRVEGQPEEAETLYTQAVTEDPNFTMAEVNLATVQIELGHFERASRQLARLRQVSLGREERREVESASLTLNEFFRLEGAVRAALEEEKATPLEQVLRETPDRLLEPDAQVLAQIGSYANLLRRLPPRVGEAPPKLPEDWPLIEALFMIPVVETVPEYRRINEDLAGGLTPKGDLKESLNMKAVVEAARTARRDLLDPVKAEAHLRYWHALAARGMPRLIPGHFKMTSNLTRQNPLVRRAEPHRVAGTFRRFIDEVYSGLAAGVPRGIIALMAVLDIHPFADGNGRLALSWLNRELEWVGESPALFPRRIGFQQRLGRSLRAARLERDLSPVLSVIREGQRYAREFCAELAVSRRGGKSV